MSIALRGGPPLLRASAAPASSAGSSPRASSLLDELWLARAQHLAHVRRGSGVVVVSDGRKLAETSARSVARAVREATTLVGRGARSSTMYLALGASELDRGELAALADSRCPRVVLDAGTTRRFDLRVLATRLATLGIETVVVDATR